MKVIIALLPATLLFVQCSAPVTTEENAAAPKQIAETDSTDYFPVTAYLQAQMAELDSMPVTILQVKGTGRNTDSSWISMKELRPQLQPFTEDTIDKRNMIRLFKENRFNDQSTESVTLTYLPAVNPLPGEVSLRRWDVYVQPDNGKVKMIYLNRVVTVDNDTLTQQMIWKTGQWAKIATTSFGGKIPPAIQKEIKWIWGNDTQ